VAVAVDQLADIAKGKYTEITSIVAPASAVAGSKVDVTVNIKNIDSLFDHLVACLVIYDGTRFIDQVANIRSLQTHSFTGSFTMPNKAVTIYAYSYYPVGADWILDDQAQKNVALAVVYKGTISKKELGYDSARATIPASNIPKDEGGLVHIWGRNDMTTNQKMGIWWEVKDPGGIIRETYARWETLWTGSGKAQEFIGGRFNLDKTGTWKIAVQLFMNPADQVVVDDYYGNLCAVILAVPESEFRGFAISEYDRR